jgi:hypothetical protein
MVFYAQYLAVTFSYPRAGRIGTCPEYMAFNGTDGNH